MTLTFKSILFTLASFFLGVALTDAITLTNAKFPGKCPTNPCASVGQVCCTTYPCALPLNASKPIVEVAVNLAFAANGFLVAIRLAMDDILADQAAGLMFPDQEIRIVWNDPAKSVPNSLNSLWCTAINSTTGQPTVPLLIGPVYSSQCLQSAAVASYFNIPQIGPNAASMALSDKTLYSTFSRVQTKNSYASVAVIQLLKMYNWTTATAIYSQTDEQSSDMMDGILTGAKAAGIRILTVLSYRVGDDPTPLLERVKSSGSRIVIAPITATDFTPIMEAAAKVGVAGSEYVWVTGQQTPAWNNIVGSVASNLVRFRQVFDATAPATVSLQNRWKALYLANATTTFNLSDVPDVTFNVYDSIRFGFYVLDKMQKSGMDIGNSSQVVSAIRNTLWTGGTTGPVVLDSSGDRLLAMNIWSYQKRDPSVNYSSAATTDREWQRVFQVSVNASTSVADAAMMWGSGRSVAPIDVPVVVNQRLQASKGSTITFMGLAGLAILAALSAMSLNFYYRNETYIKMSSPVINQIIVFGIIMCFASVIVYAASELSTSVSTISIMCNTRMILLVLGFTFSFGGMAAKTFRISKLFNQKSLNAVVITTWDLIRYICAFLVIDVIVLTGWLVLEPQTATIVTISSFVDPTNSDRILAPFAYSCRSANMDYYLGSIYLVKGILVLAAAQLAFQTKNVDIPALNDSKQIGLSIYSVGLVSVLAVPALRFISVEQTDASFIIANAAILFSGLVTLGILFIPKVYVIRNGEVRSETTRRVTGTSNVSKKPTTQVASNTNGTMQS